VLENVVMRIWTSPAVRRDGVLKVLLLL
jgi:hypothetical protein